MKKIIYILPIVLSLILTSCNKDDNSDLIDYDSVTVLTQLEANAISSEDDLLNFKITLPNSFESDIDMRVLVTLDDGRTKTKQVLIPSGETSVNSSIYLPAADDFSVGYEGLENGGNLKVLGGILNEPIKGKQFLFNSNKIAIKLFDKVASVDESSLTVLMDWDSAMDADLDLFVNDSSNINIDSSESGSRYETVNLPNSSTDGIFSISTLVYATTLDNIPYKVFLRQPNGSQTLVEGVLENVTAGSSYELFTITKSGTSYVVN